jgi:hypothetical protein
MPITAAYLAYLTHALREVPVGFSRPSEKRERTWQTLALLQMLLERSGWRTWGWSQIIVSAMPHGKPVSGASKTQQSVRRAG